MHRIHLVSLCVMFVLLQAALTVLPSIVWFDDLVMAGYVFLFG